MTERELAFVWITRQLTKKWMASTPMILKTFAYHSPSKHGLEKIQNLREGFSLLASVIESAAPDSREKSIALTNLETAAMWAVKAVVFNDPESIVSDEVAP